MAQQTPTTKVTCRKCGRSARVQKEQRPNVPTVMWACMGCHTMQPVAEVPGYAFRKGFDYGKANGPASPNDAESILGSSAPCDEITAFCCGSEDGAVGDRWRLDRLGAPWHANPLFSR